MVSHLALFPMKIKISVVHILIQYLTSKDYIIIHFSRRSWYLYLKYCNISVVPITFYFALQKRIKEQYTELEFIFVWLCKVCSHQLKEQVWLLAYCKVTLKHMLMYVQIAGVQTW